MINELKLIDLQTHVDDRGHLTQVFEQSKDMPEIRRMYLVSNFNIDTVRGYHKNIKENKCFFVVRGAAKFVLVDDRKESSTYKEQQTVVLSDKKPQLLIVPPHVYNGWKAIDKETLVLGTADTSMSEHKDERISPDSFGDVWSTKNR